MKHFPFFLALIILCLIACSKKDNTENVTPPVVAELNDTTPTKYRDMLGVGIDVDWSKTGTGMANYSTQTVVDFKNRGIKHVRIRVANDATSSLFDDLDKQINDCIKNNLVPVLAYQADEFKNYPFSRNSMAKAINWWTTVSQRYQKVSNLLSFDLMIECTDSLNDYPNRLNEYFEATVSEIRKTNPKRIIMISPTVRSSPENLGLLKIPTQHNNFLMAEWHFYASGPSQTNANKLWTTGTAGEKKIITDKINIASAWQTKNNIPTWVGAWMPGDYNDGDNYSISEQVNFASFVTCQLNNTKIPFAVNSDTKFYDREKSQWLSLRANVLDAILKPVCK